MVIEIVVRPSLGSMSSTLDRVIEGLNEIEIRKNFSLRLVYE